MSLAPSPIVNAAAPARRPLPAKEILWPTYPGYGDGGGSDSGIFPSLTAIKARRAAPLPQALKAFVEAAWTAQDRILILDDYLFKPEKDQDQSRQSRYDQILSWLPKDLVANDVRFLTKAHEDLPEQREIEIQFQAHAAAINQRAPRRAGMVKIEIRFTLGTEFPHVHDRFAVIDNELWHFGATVGGLHRLVNAVTRGWDADAVEALRFFNDAWNGDGISKGRRRG